MTAGQLRGVRAASIRVALVTTAIVTAVYVAVAVVVAVIVVHNLTAAVDTRLGNALARLHEVASLRLRSGEVAEPPGQPRFGPPLLLWTVHPDGTVTHPASTPELPAGLDAVTGARTVSIGGVDVRVAGASLQDGHVVLGQTMDSVASARETVILAELAVGPVLLCAVFLGALSIGRRVGAPIELARQRQLEFAADASHELRTPLSVIEAHATLALAQPRDDAWYRRGFERVERESKRMRRLVDDLLWLARFDAAQARPDAEPVDVAILARQAADRFSSLAEARHLTLTVLPAGGSHVVTVPPEWLDRLLGVLLDNACKYAPDGGGIEVRIVDEGSRVRLSVEDSGPGIPADERSRVFDRFHRATDSGTGAGLGLAIADAVVRATGGRWDVGTSSLGGASMSVSWTRSLAGPTEASGPAPVVSPSPQ